MSILWNNKSIALKARNDQESDADIAKAKELVAVLEGGAGRINLKEKH
jgi:hypothetical protein